MRKLLILTFCILFAACAGNRTIDGETNRNWIKIVSSKVDTSGTTRDVCFLLNLSFYPGTAYDRIKNNPSSCLEECCWYSENKTVEYYFNDGFIKELEDTGVSRRYYPDHIKIKLNYSSFLNRLSAKADTAEGITKDGIVRLDYDDVYKVKNMNNESFYKVESKIYPDQEDKTKSKGSAVYKTVSMSGLNRDELLARAEAERDSYYSKAVEERYLSPEKEYVEESMRFTGQVSPFDKTDKETKWLSKKTLAEEEALREARYEQNRYTQEEKDKYLQMKNGKKKAVQDEVEEITEEFEYKVTKNSKGADAKGEDVEYVTFKSTKSSVKDNKVNTVVPIENAKLNTNVNDEIMYDVQRPYAQEAKIVYIEPKVKEKLDSDTLKKKLAYEKTEAVKLLKRFYGDEIDEYIHALDKYKRTEGQVLITNDKIWQTKKIATMIYQVDCNIKGEVILLGTKSGTETVDYPIYCGSYIVDLDDRTVEAKDDMAKKIARKEY